MAAKSRTMAQQKTKEAYCFIVPAFIYMILVLGYPIVYNIILSLKDVNVKNLKSELPYLSDYRTILIYSMIRHFFWFCAIHLFLQ